MGKRKRNIDPCKLKGGTRHDKAEDKYITGCDCALVAVCHGRKSTYLPLPIKPKKDNPVIEKAVFIPFDQLHKAPLETVKKLNEKAYLNNQSRGLIKFKRKNKSKFQGCKKLEEQLINEGLVNHTPFDGRGAPLLLPQGYDSTASTAVSSTLRADEYFDMDPNLKMAERLFNGESTPNTYDSYTDEYYQLTDTKVSEMLRPAPINIKHSILRGLIARRVFDNSDSKAPSKTNALQMTAILIDRGFSNKDIESIMRLFPDYDISKFKSLQSKVHLRVESEIKKAVCSAEDSHIKRLAKFDEFWKTLTEKQKVALKKTKMAPYGKELTFKDAAKELGISVDSLMDRYNGAIKKLKASYFF